jgi:AcrR family transcriptional regulator
MRVKTDERRQAIIEKAKDVFREVGYDRASMSEIAKRLGGSKATLYSYFSSKEELFTSVMRLSPEVGEIFAPFTDPDRKVATLKELREILERFAQAYLKLHLRPEILAVRRNLVAQGDRSDIGKQAFEAGPAQNFMMVAAFLYRMMEEGHLRLAEPRVAMVHLIALIESELLPPRLMGIAKDFPSEFVQEAALRAVDAYLRAYAREKN